MTSHSTEQVRIPQGDATITVNLSVKEAMALGQQVRFHSNPQLAASARRKVAESLERELLPHAGKIDYAELRL